MNGPRFRPTWVEVDLDRLRHNVRALTPPGAELMAVVKADAYGHGDAPVARAAIDAGATWLGVALVEEGLRLRLAGIEAQILVLSEAPEGSEAVLLAHRLTPTIYSRPGLRRLAAAARGPVAVHVKIDTGMHRVGLWPLEAAPAFLREVVDAGLEVEGLWTHLAKSEDDEVTTKMQLDRLAGVAEASRAAGLAPRYLHAANSGGLLRHPDVLGEREGGLPVEQRVVDDLRAAPELVLIETAVGAEHLQRRPVVDVFAGAEGLDERLLVGQMGEHPQLDLGVVRRQQYVTRGRDERPSNLASELGANRDVLQVRIGAAQASRGRDRLVERRVDAPGLRVHEQRQRIDVRAFQFVQAAPVEDETRQLVRLGELLEHFHRGRC